VWPQTRGCDAVPISSEAIDMLRKKNLVEGRKPNVFVAKDIAKDTDHKVDLSQHKDLIPPQ
jgi:ATP-dependent DNA helicase RecG